MGNPDTAAQGVDVLAVVFDSSRHPRMEDDDWRPLEKRLNAIADRRHQAIFRVWMEYPGHRDGIPVYLEKQGVKVTEWMNTNTAPFPAKICRTPDYGDLRVRKMMADFIAAIGHKYDGDPRIGFITAGLLGTWGEWHTYPHNELMADKIVQYRAWRSR